MLSNAERRHFEAIRAAFAADPYMVAVSRAAQRRERRRRIYRWLAPLVVARRERRYAARMLAYGG